MHQVRAAALTAYLEVAQFVCLDGLRMLREAGINPADLEDPQNRLPAGPVIQLLERSAELSHCDNFGLLMAQARTFASLGPVSLLLERLPNVREVVEASISFQRHMNEITTISMEDDGDTCLIRFDIVPDYWGVQVFDNTVAMAHRVLTAVSGYRWKPACIHLMRETPKDPAPWRRYFSVPLEFGASFNGLSSSCEKMLIPNPLADEGMARNARQLLHMVPLPHEPGVFSDRVRRTISLLLPSGRATLDHVSAQLGLSPRTLQRHLEEEGHTFAAVLDAVRRDMAKGFLAVSGHPITAIAPMLGYSSPSSFTRWFAGAFGMSPQTWRAAESKAANDARTAPPSVWKH